MADKMVKYVEEVVTLEVKKEDALDETSVTPTKESSAARRLVMKGNGPDVAETSANLLRAEPTRVRLKKGITAETIAERARRARAVDATLAAVDRIRDMLLRERKLRNHELQKDLVALYNQIKAQREEDEALWSDFADLIAYFNNK
jgi:hypothetical protein